MYLENISLVNFKNYKELNVSFSPKLNLITGSNGSGKTNILDAIHYLSMGRSAVNTADLQNINHDEAFFVINGNFNKGEKKFKVGCHLQKNQKKTLFLNKKKVEKISEFIGHFPVVIITPEDEEIIKEGSEARRNFFDSIFSQLDRQYLMLLIEYVKALKIRNLLLKQFAERNSFNEDLLEPYSLILIERGRQISALREKYLEEFLRFFQSYHQLLTQNKEVIKLVYAKSLDIETYDIGFKDALQRDRILERTTMGVHKDDYRFQLEDFTLKKFGSQGQQKSFLIALKFAQHALIKAHTGISPLLLLDDIFDKLDEERIRQLFEIILREEFGQAFITDARTVSAPLLKIVDSIEKVIIHIKNNNVFAIKS